MSRASEPLWTDQYRQRQLRWQLYGHDRAGQPAWLRQPLYFRSQLLQPDQSRDDPVRRILQCYDTRQSPQLRQCVYLSCQRLRRDQFWEHRLHRGLQCDHAGLWRHTLLWNHLLFVQWHL